MTKGLLVIVIFVLLALLAAVTFPSSVNEEISVDEYIEESMKQIGVADKKMMYNEAQTLYESLTQKYPENWDLKIGYADYCMKHGFEKQAISSYLSIYDEDPSDIEIGEILLEKYKDSPRDLYPFMEKYKQDLSVSEMYKALEKESISRTHNIRGNLSDINDWSRGNYCFAKNVDGSIGVISADGSLAVSFLYTDILSFSQNDNLISIKDNGQYVFTDPNGTRKYVPYDSESNELIYPEYIGPVESGVANICLDGKWGYCDLTMNIGYMQYEKTNPFSEGVAAAKRDGKWELLNFDFDNILLETVDDIYTDEYGYCCENGIVYLKKSSWEMHRIIYDDRGYAISAEKIGDKVFEDVKSFGEHGAVKYNGKWGLLDNNGSWIIEPIYDDAYSFRCDVAFVKQGETWKAISLNGEQLLTETYDDATSFSKKGCAGVLKYGSWSIVQLEKYYYLER